MDDGGEESDDFSEDRRDRTSEAGTSGSGSAEDEDDVGEDARYSSDVRERMGEPSTSGRDHRVALSSAVIDTAEVKEEIVEAKLSSHGVGASGKVWSLDDSESLCAREPGRVLGLMREVGSCLTLHSGR